MRRVILESPYAGNVELNERYARACMADCLRRGEAPYASHLLYTQPGVLDDLVPEQREIGIRVALGGSDVRQSFRECAHGQMIRHRAQHGEVGHFQRRNGGLGFLRRGVEKDVIVLSPQPVHRLNQQVLMNEPRVLHEERVQLGQLP